MQPVFDIHPPDLKHQVCDLQEFIFPFMILNFLHKFQSPLLNDAAFFFSDNQSHKSRDFWGKSGKTPVVFVLKLWLPLVVFSNCFFSLSLSLCAGSENMYSTKESRENIDKQEKTKKAEDEIF